MTGRTRSSRHPGDLQDEVGNVSLGLDGWKILATDQEKEKEEKMSVEMITLPSRREMHRKLVAICDPPQVVRGFYPLLLRHAGKQMTPEGIDLMLALTQYDYAGNLPRCASFLQLAPA